MNTFGKTDFINKVVATLRKKLDRAKFRHSLGVARTARMLAEKFNYPGEVAYLSGLLHDFGRTVPLKSYRKILPRKISARVSGNLFLLHGEVGAYLAKKIFKIRNKEILLAIQRHTLGAPKNLLSKLDKIIFLADAIAPDRRFPFVKKLRRLAFRNLDKAVFFACQNKLLYVLKKKQILDLRGVQTYNSFLLKYSKND